MNRRTLFPNAPHPGAWRARRRPGFTLIELLVAIVLLTLVLGLVYQSFATVSVQAEREAQRLAEQQDLRLLLNLVAADLQGIQHLTEYFKTGRPTGLRAETTLEGVKDYSKADFHAAVPARFHRSAQPGTDPELHEVGYEVRPAAADGSEGEGLVLVRREDYYVDDTITDGGLSVVVADRISDFFLEYLPEGDAVGTPQERWETRWDSDERPGAPLPLAMRLTIGRELGPLGQTARPASPGAPGTPDARDAEPETLLETMELNLPVAQGVTK